MHHLSLPVASISGSQKYSLGQCIIFRIILDANVKGEGHDMKIHGTKFSFGAMQMCQELFLVKSLIYLTIRGSSGK